MLVSTEFVYDITLPDDDHATPVVVSATGEVDRHMIVNDLKLELYSKERAEHIRLSDLSLRDIPKLIEKVEAKLIAKTESPDPILRLHNG